MARKKGTRLRYSDVEWARLKRRNGFALTRVEKFLLGERDLLPAKAADAEAVERVA